MRATPPPKQSHPASPDQFLAFIDAYLELLLAYWECVEPKKRL